jgi:hypothetical protein
MYMLQLFISLLILSNVFHQTLAGVVRSEIDNSTQENQTTPDGSDVDKNLIENSTVYNNTPSESGENSSLPLYQPANVGSQNLGSSSVGSQQGQGIQGQGFQGRDWQGLQSQGIQGQGLQGQGLQGQGLQGQGFQGQGIQGQGLQGYQNFGAGAGKGGLQKGSMVGAVAKGKGVGADFIPPMVGAPYPQFHGLGNVYGYGGDIWCNGCGGNLVIPPLPPIPPQIYPPSYQWHDFPPLPPFPQVFPPAAPLLPVSGQAPIMPPPMQQDSSMGQQLLQNTGFGGGINGQEMKGQQQTFMPPMQQQQGQAMQPIMGQHNQQMQGQNFPILSQQGQNQQLQGQGMQGF